MCRDSFIRSVHVSGGRWVLALCAVLALAACGDDDSGLPPAGVDCADLTAQPAIVTDIDETLTTSDDEFIQQVLEPDHVPQHREGSVELIRGFYERGYQILYLTARYESLELMDGTSGREATEAWLEARGFPMSSQRTRVVLSQDSTSGDDTVAYKRGAIETLMAEGWDFQFAFGNAVTDIRAYAEAGIALEHTYIIGEEAGDGSTMAVVGEAWTTTITELLDPQGRVCDF